MASNKHLDDPPSASSSDEEEEDNQTHQEESEEEESEQEQDAQNPNPNSIQSDEEDDEEEDESDEQEEEEEEVPSPVKAINSPTASDFAIKPSKKIEPNAKSKIKIKFTSNVEDEKKLVNKLVWSDDDEIMLLEAFIECHNDASFSSVSDFEKFYEYVKEYLPGNATYSQVYEKMRRLKKKFKDNCERVGDDGDGYVFAKAHEKRLYELSKRVWGIDGCVSVNGGGTKSRMRPCGNKRKIEVEVEEMHVEEEERDGERFERMYPYWNAGLSSEALKFPNGVVALVKECIGVIGEEKAKEMDMKWKAVFENEAVLKKRRIALLSEVENVE